MDAEARERLAEFVTARSPALIRLAYLLTGDQHAAEDLLQTALLKCARRWKHIRDEDPEAYVRAAMYHEQVSWWRRRARRPEVVVDHPPDTGYPDPSTRADLRLSLRNALLQLRPHHRAVLVLRYYEDMGETQVAELLSCSIGTVKARKKVARRASSSGPRQVRRRLAGVIEKTIGMCDIATGASYPRVPSR